MPGRAVATIGTPILACYTRDEGQRCFGDRQREVKTMALWDTVRRVLGLGTGASGAAAAAGGDPDGVYVYCRCRNCGDSVAVRLNKRNDLSREGGGPGTLFVRKEIMDNRCFRLMQAEVWFDDAYRIVTADIEGGILLTREEYEADQEAKSAARAQDTE